MGLVRLYVQVVLRHILAVRHHHSPLSTFNQAQSDSDSEVDSNHDEDRRHKVSFSKVHAREVSRRAGSTTLPAEMLDFSGPELGTGYTGWLWFLQIIGQINWTNKPLYMCVLYKLAVLVLVNYTVLYRFAWRFYTLIFPDGHNKNPIFIFITCLATFTVFIQVLVNFKLNLFDLCPVFKILQTPRLCFLRKDILHKLGNQTLMSSLLAHIYLAIMVSLLTTNNFAEFVAEFSIVNFLLNCFSLSAFSYYIMGICNVDLYIRSAFGHWLMGLKSHLELRFTQAHRRQRRLRQLTNPPSRAWSLNSNFSQQIESPANGLLSVENQRDQLDEQPPASFDEIQSYLNNMDDHLEVMRSIQEISLVGISLMTFLVNGSMFLVVYNLIVNQHDYYHGFLLLILSLSYIYFTFLCYFGDRWVYYALSSFVQTVEDEYFMQNSLLSDTTGSLTGPSQGASGQEQRDNSRLNVDCKAMLVISKKDVLFCREFLHQFENHLATPWSQLTFKSHLHILRTFVTLMAAQIIFDHEH